MAIAKRCSDRSETEKKGRTSHTHYKAVALQNDVLTWGLNKTEVTPKESLRYNMLMADGELPNLTHLEDAGLPF